MPPVNEKHQLAVSATFMALGTGISRVLGFIRDTLMAAYFPRFVTDAWIVAFRLPNLFRRLLGEGSLSVSFIPVLTDFLKKEDDPGAKRFVGQMFTMLLFIVTILTILGTVFAPQIVNLIASGEGFTSIPGKLELTIRHSRIMFCFIWLVSMYAYFMAVLNTLRIFWLPAFAPALWNVSMIVFMVWGRGFLHEDSLAWGVVAGGVLQLAIMIPEISRRGYLPSIRSFWGDPHIKKVLRAMGPSILGLSVLQFAVIINTHFATRLEEGSNTWIFLADRVLELPLAMFAVSLGTVSLPTFAAFWSCGDKDGLTESSLHAFKLVLFVAIPAAIGIYFLATPIIDTLFHHGRFSDHDTIMAGKVLRVYGFGVLGAAGVRVMAPVFYAMKNTWLPALAAAIALTCHVFIAQFLMALWGIQGLALSSAFSGIINLMVLIVAYQVLVTRFPWRDLVFSVGRFIIAGVALGFATQLQHPLEAFGGSSTMVKALRLLIVISVSASLYMTVCYFLKVPEFTETMATFAIKIRGRLKKKSAAVS